MMNGNKMQRNSFIALGGNQESKVALGALLDAGCPVSGAVILPPESRSVVTDYAPLDQFCEKNGIPYIATQDVNGPKVVNWLADRNAEHLFVLGWSQIISRDTRRVFPGLCVGSHPTPLPLRRGRAPVPWTIIENHRSSAVSLFVLEDHVDSGKILVQRKFDIGERAYARDVYDLSAHVLGEAYVELHAALENGVVPEVETGDVAPSMRGKRVVADGLIDFSKSQEAIDRLVRAVSHPYPGAYFYYRDRRIITWRSDLHEGMEYKGVIGQILARGARGVLVQTGSEPIWLDDFTCDGEMIERPYFRVGDTLNFRIEDRLFDIEQRLAIMESKLDEL